MMTEERMALIELVEKQADGDLVREMLAFAAERIMDAEVETRTGAAKGARTPMREVQRNGYRYHRRSRAETKMHCVKLLGQRLSARDFDRQVAEFQIRVAVLNGFTALGTPITEVAG